MIYSLVIQLGSVSTMTLGYDTGGWELRSPKSRDHHYQDTFFVEIAQASYITKGRTGEYYEGGKPCRN